jgi:peptidoglycan/xylan/chitin deacetylase (PgdA/CDA1 family)
MRLFLLSIFVCCVSFVKAQKKICITIDDLPTTSRFYNTQDGQQKLTSLLLNHLRHYRVPATGFVIGQFVQPATSIDSTQVRLLRQWVEAGMELGNHSFSHPDYHQKSSAGFLADVARNDSVLKPMLRTWKQPLRFFRHPFLHRGNTIAKQDSLVAFLKSRGYQEAPVTIDNADYIFSAAYDKALLRRNSALASTVGRQYVDYMMACIHYYEAQSDSLFGRSISHTLLTHANTINAAYLGEILSRLASEGYQFVSLADALKDTAYSSPDTYVGMGGISWLHRWALTKGKRGAFFRGEPEVPAEISALADS